MFQPVNGSVQTWYQRWCPERSDHKWTASTSTGVSGTNPDEIQSLRPHSEGEEEESVSFS